MMPRATRVVTSRVISSPSRAMPLVTATLTQAVWLIW